MTSEQLDLVVLAVALFSLAHIWKHIKILRRVRSQGPPTTSNAHVMLPRLPLIMIAYAAPFLINLYLLMFQTFSLGTTLAQLLVTSAMVSLGLTLSLLSFAYDLNTRYNKAWVKFLDFPYLALAVFGLYRVLEASYGPPSIWGQLSIGALALAIAVRLSKATIETYFDDWAGTK